MPAVSEIIIPEPGLASHLASESLAPGLIRLLRPEKDTACFVSIMQALPGVEKTTVNFGEHPAEILRQWAMPSGYITFVAAHIEPMTEDNHRMVNDFMQSLRERAKSLDLNNLPYGELRAVGIMDVQNGIGRILDINAEFLRRLPERTQSPSRSMPPGQSYDEPLTSMTIGPEIDRLE